MYRYSSIVRKSFVYLVFHVEDDRLFVTAYSSLGQLFFYAG